MKIVWFSRHKPIQKQVDELKRLFGENIELAIDPNPFSTADDVIERFKRNKAQEMVIVAPLSVIDAITKRGIKPLYAEMKPVQSDDFDVEVNGRKFVFERFVRIKGIVIEKEEVKQKNRHIAVFPFPYRDDRVCINDKKCKFAAIPYRYDIIITTIIVNIFYNMSRGWLR